MVTKALRTRTVKIKNDLYEKMQKEGIENYAEFVSNAVEKKMKEIAEAKNKAEIEEKLEAYKKDNERLESKLSILFKIAKISSDEQRINREMGKISNEIAVLFEKGQLKGEKKTNKYLELMDNRNKLIDQYEKLLEEQNKIGELEDVVSDIVKEK